jgi:hypothetical protein
MMKIKELEILILGGVAYISVLAASLSDTLQIKTLPK